MNFFTLLKNEHKDAKDTFKKLLAEDSIDSAETDLLCNKLLLHMDMEEKYFYPRMKQAKETEDLAVEAKLEHTEAKALIRALLKNSLDDIEKKVKLETLQLEIEHHVDEEESDLFPLAKKVLDDDEVKAITEKMLALKEKSGLASGKR